MSKHTPLREPTVEDNSQCWAGMDGATAWHLIDRHADGWADVAKMMGEWLAANTPPAAPVQEPVAAQCKFDREQKWVWCEIAHHNLVQSEPHNWPGYQTRLLYTTPPAAQPAHQEPAESRCANCGKTSSEALEVLSDYPEDGEWFCSTECRDQHNELDCPHSTHNGYRHPVESAKLIECERIMRELASWLGCGGYNADEFIPSEFEAKIRHGIEHLHPPVVPAQEPVACRDCSTCKHNEWPFGMCDGCSEFVNWEPTDATPPAAQPAAWVGLTAQMLEEEMQRHRQDEAAYWLGGFRTGALWADAKLREKNGNAA